MKFKCPRRSIRLIAGREDSPFSQAQNVELAAQHIGAFPSAPLHLRFISKVHGLSQPATLLGYWLLVWTVGANLTLVSGASA
jgi:hypothetical protein